MNRTLNVLIVCALFAVPGMASLITNGSFETPSVGPVLAPGSTAIVGWTVVGPDSIDILPDGSAGIAAENGSYFLDLTGPGYGPSQGGVTQTVTLAAGNYNLTFYLGSLDSYEPDSVYASAGDQSNVVFTNSDLGAGTHWNLETLNFNVATSGPVTISLVGDASGTLSSSPYVGLDDVDVETAGSAPAGSAPEPSYFIPVLLGLGAWACIRRKTHPPAAAI